MKALVLFDKRDGATELRDVPKPQVGEGDVLIRVKAAAVCGADIEFYRAKMVSSLRPPVVLGHEFCGIIEEVGSQVQNWKPGDRVVSDNTGSICGHCFACQTGQYLLCSERLGAGYSIDGGFAEFVKIPGHLLQRMPSALYRLPKNLSFEEGAILEPSCNAYRALIQEGRLMAGETVAIFGPGPIGLFVTHLANIAGSSKIFLFGTSGDEKRLEFGEKLGALTCKVDQENISEFIKKNEEYEGVDCVVDAAGHGSIIEEAMKIIRPLGRIVKVGWGKPYSLQFDSLMVKGATITGHFGYDYISWRNILKLAVSGFINYRSFITSTFPLENWKEAFSVVEERSVIKAVFKT